MTAPVTLHSGAFDAHVALRAATHATHIRLHGLAQFQSIAEGRLDRAHYADLLRSLHTYHTAIAESAARGGLLHLSSSPRRRELLETDLASLGASPARGRLNWPALSREALHGALYVAEGSALGGRVIARQLDYLFGDTAEGRTFFRGDGETGGNGGAGLGWRTFLRALAQDCDEAAMPQLLAGAEASFALFERCVAT